MVEAHRGTPEHELALGTDFQVGKQASTSSNVLRSTSWTFHGPSFSAAARGADVARGFLSAEDCADLFIYALTVTVSKPERDMMHGISGRSTMSLERFCYDKPLALTRWFSKRWAFSAVRNRDKSGQRRSSTRMRVARYSSQDRNNSRCSAVQAVAGPTEFRDTFRRCKSTRDASCFAVTPHAGQLRIRNPHRYYGNWSVPSVGTGCCQIAS